MSMYRDETEREHRERDSRTWGAIAIVGVLFKASRFWISILLMVTGATWVINILGETTVFNSPDTYYSGTDPKTGQFVVTKGCRPEKVLPDGSCNTAISWEIVRTAFPHFGPARQVVKTTKND